MAWVALEVCHQQQQEHQLRFLHEIKMSVATLPANKSVFHDGDLDWQQ